MKKEFLNEINNQHYTTSTINIKGEDRKYYTLDIGKNNIDAVIFYFTGSGCHDTSFMLYPLFKDLNLNARIVSLSKKGVNKNSPGKTCGREFVRNDDIKNHVNENILLMNSILKQQRYKKIIVLGHSEGADTAWRVAEKYKAVTHVAIMHRGIGMNNLDELRHRSNDNNNYLSFEYKELLLDIESDKKKYTEDDYIIIRSMRSWKSFLSDKRVPAEVLAKSQKNILILMGNKDKHVPILSMYKSKAIFCKNNRKLTAIVKHGFGHTISIRSNTRISELNMLSNWVYGNKITVKHPFELLSCNNNMVKNEL